MPTKAAALFVDFENLYYGLVSRPFKMSGDDALSTCMDVLNELRRSTREQGEALVVERCYADWERLPASAQRQLQISGVLPRYVDGRTAKSSAGIEMSLDVLQVVLTRPELTHVILVGGDRDYLPVLRRLKEHHRSILIGSLKQALSGDVREFASNYSLAEVVELNKWVEGEEEPPAQKVMKTPPQGTEKPKKEYEPQTTPPKNGYFKKRKELNIQVVEWHERYLRVMMRFLADHGYSEIHLSPFFRWLNDQDDFRMVSTRDQRKVLDDLKTLGAVLVEDREGYQGYTFGVATLDWNHPLVQKVNQT